MSRAKLTTEGFFNELGEKLKDNAYAGPNIKSYKPHEKQHQFHTSTKKKKLYIGGNRSGKSVGGVNEGIWRATRTHPYRPELNAMGPTRGRVIGVDFTSGVEQIIFPIYKQWLYPSALVNGSWEDSYNRVTKTLTLANKSTIEFKSYDQDLDKHAGTSRHWIHFDEEPPEPIFKENTARLIDTNGDYWITMTPVEGMTWVYDDLYEANVGNPDAPVEVIEINSIENPYLSNEAIESFIDGGNAEDAEIRIGGKFIQVGGRIYKNFNHEPGVLHVLKDPIEFPKEMFKDWLWICSLDHGFNNPTAVYWTAIDANGFAITFEEHYKSDLTIDQHAKIIIARIKEHGRAPDIFVADPSIAARNGVSGTSIQQEYQKYGISWMLGNNDVRAGIIRVRRYLNTRPYVGKRNHPLFVKDDDANFNKWPMWRITPNCVELIKEMRKYRWKTYRNKKLAFENNAYDEPHKKDDHGCDSMRYAFMSQPDLFADTAAQHESTMNKAYEHLNELGLDSSEIVSVMKQQDRDRADPWAVGDSRDSDVNQSPLSGGGWEFDEHMGGIY